MRVILVKKTLIVSAVAMAISGNAIAAEMYGNIRLGLRTSDYTPGTDELDVVSGKLVLGSKGSSDLGNGLTASYGIELEHDQADETGGVGVVDFDKSWVALSGGFGKVQAGRFGDLAGYTCGGTDLLTHGTAEACSLGHNTEFNNAIGYMGGAGAFEFGVILTFDGTADDQDSMIGAKFSGDNFSVGFTSFDDNAAFPGPALTKTQIGGTYQLGDIGLGITIGDDDSATDSGGTDLGLYMPLAGGNLAVVLSTLDAVDSDSFDIEYSRSLGGGAYTGVEFNSIDAPLAEDRLTAYLGMNF